MNYRRTLIVNLVKIIFKLLAWPTWSISLVLLCLLQKFESENSQNLWTTNNALILWIKDFSNYLKDLSNKNYQIFTKNLKPFLISSIVKLVSVFFQARLFQPNQVKVGLVWIHPSISRKIILAIFSNWPSTLALPLKMIWM